MTTMRGPKRSTNHPSIGTSHVSVATKIVKAIWMAGRPQWNFASIGSTKYVQPYCRFAIITMQMTPATSWSQRLTGIVFSEAGLVANSTSPGSRSLVQLLPSRIQISHDDAKNLTDDVRVPSGHRRIGVFPIAILP